MTVKELIRELLDCNNLDADVRLYSLVDMEHIDPEEREFEFIGHDISVDDESINSDFVYINGNY